MNMKDFSQRNPMLDIKPPKTKKLLVVNRHYGFQTFLKWLKITLFAFIVICIGIFIFIKMNTSIASDLADNVLRPLIGTERVIAIENIFFNLSDIASQIIYKFKNPTSPLFLDQNKNNTTAFSTAFNLNNIPPNPAFKNSSLKNEGIWNNVPSAVFPNKEIMAYTFVRPDAQRSYAIVSIVKMDHSKLKIGAVAGTAEPGSSLGNPGSGKVPENIANSGNLVAYFNGGFLYVDGNYGMIVGNKTYAPLKNNSGTIVGYSNGSVKILNYTGQNLGKNISFIRQNGLLIVEDGAIPLTPSNGKQEVGRVVINNKIIPGAVYTWRSGLGITKKGNLLYAVGNALSPTTLARALQMAGAVNAIQLDINPTHIYFNLLTKNNTRSYDATSLNGDLAKVNTRHQVLNGSTRDYFYIYK
jgi:hypothetical protein